MIALLVNHLLVQNQLYGAMYQIHAPELLAILVFGTKLNTNR